MRHTLRTVALVAASIAVTAPPLPAGLPLLAAWPRGAYAEAAASGAPSESVPAYEAVDLGESSAPPLDGALARAADGAVADLLAPTPGDPSRSADTAMRRLAAIGAPALTRIAHALPLAPWRARAALIGAVAEMDAAAATPLLILASRDPSFAVREAAVLGIGKTGNALGARALAYRADVASEPAWRVRAATATALRRARLRGVGDSSDVNASMLTLLGDADDDVRRAALANTAPLAITEALPLLLDTYQDRSRSSRDRGLALAALRAYRVPSEQLLAALRTGFTTSEDTEEAVRAGRALLEIRGVVALEDRDVSDAVLRHLMDEGAQEVRDVLGRLGKRASPWLLAETHDLANRIAAGRVDHQSTPFDTILDALLQVDEEAGIAALRSLLSGPDASTFDRETRLSALRRTQLGYAARLAAEVRALWTLPAGKDLLPEVLRAVVVSGGEDRERYVAEALRSDRTAVRSAAMDALDAFQSLATPPELRTLAETAPRPEERRRALSSLGRRDTADAARIAASLLAHPDPAMREVAARLLGATPSAESFDLLVARLSLEDGAALEPARATQPEGEPTATSPAPGPVTGTPDEESAALRRRRLIRGAIARMLRTAGGERSRAVLLTLLSDREPRLRDIAAQELRGLATDIDGAVILASLDAESDEDARGAILRLAATLDGSEPVRARFGELLANDASRATALKVLAEPQAKVVPTGIEVFLADLARTDDERLSALRILERAHRLPAAAQLANLARGSRTLDFFGEVVRMIALSGEPTALPEILALIEGAAIDGADKGTDKGAAGAHHDSDPQRLSLAVRALAEERAPDTAHASAALPVVLRLHAATLGHGVGAAERRDPRFQLHRECVTALGRLGGQDAARALVAEALDPRLAAAAGRASVMTNGPFQPQEGPTPSLVRALAAALASIEPAVAIAALDDAISQRAPDLSDRTLDEGYLDGLARYLNDPLAYDLPPRRRPGLALRLWTLVTRTAPRFSPLDQEAFEFAAYETENVGRFADAAALYRISIATADVEDAARSADERRLEAARLAAFEARAAAAAGHREQALAIARALRDPDETDAGLAYRQGWLLVKLAGPDGFDCSTAEAALRFAATRDERDASARFWVAFVVQAAGTMGANPTPTAITEASERAVPLFEESMRVDSRLVEEAGGEYLTDRRGRRHRWGHHAYYLARALATAQHQDDDVAQALRTAIRLDDSYAAQAAQDPAFAQIEGLPAYLIQCLREIPSEPLR